MSSLTATHKHAYVHAYVHAGEPVENELTANESARAGARAGVAEFSPLGGGDPSDVEMLWVG